MNWLRYQSSDYIFVQLFAQGEDFCSLGANVWVNGDILFQGSFFFFFGFARQGFSVYLAVLELAL